MSKIGLLVIATGKYGRFIPPLLDSVKKYFLNNHQVTLFNFTDQPTVPEGVVRIQWDHKPWPAPTLLRYHAFLSAENQLSEMDYIYYCDADMLFVDTVGNEVLGDLVATMHPGFFNKSRQEFTYETRKESMAYLAPNEGRNYFAGGFNGGRTPTFLKLAKSCKAGIDIDSSKGITAVWHDESHMNKYLFRNPPQTILSPSYCYPESANLPFQKKLLALDKNHHDMRN